MAHPDACLLRERWIPLFEPALSYPRILDPHEDVLCKLHPSKLKFRFAGAHDAGREAPRVTVEKE
jgi:hypothetical protein